MEFCAAAAWNAGRGPCSVLQFNDSIAKIPTLNYRANNNEKKNNYSGRNKQNPRKSDLLVFHYVMWTPPSLVLLQEVATIFGFWLKLTAAVVLIVFLYILFLIYVPN